MSSLYEMYYAKQHSVFDKVAKNLAIGVYSSAEAAVENLKGELKKALGPDEFIRLYKDALNTWNDQNIKKNGDENWYWKTKFACYQAILYPLQTKQMNTLRELGLFREVENLVLISLQDCKEFIDKNLGLKDDYAFEMAKLAWEAHSPILSGKWEACPASCLNLSYSTEKLLKENGFGTIGDVCNGSFWKLSEIQGIGVDGATEIEGKIEKLGLKLTEAPPLEVKGTDSEILSVIATYCNRKKICTAEFSKDKSITSLHYRDWFNSKKRAIREGRNTDEFTDAVLNTNFDFGVKPLYRREWEAMVDQYFSENGKDDMPLDYDEGPCHLGLWAAKNLLKVNGNFGTVDTISLVYQDKTYTIQSFSNQFGIEAEVIIARLKKGWDPEEIREGEKKKIEYHGHRFWTIHDMARFYKVNPLSFEIGQAAEVHYNEIMDILLEINRTHIINKELYEKRYKGRINYYPVITLPYLCNHLEAQPQIVKLVKDTVRKVGSCIKNRCYTLTFTPQSYHSLFIGNEVTEKEVLKALYFIVDQAKEILKNNGK